MTLALFPFENFLAALPQLFHRRSARKPPLTKPCSSDKARYSAAYSTQNAIEFIAAPADTSCGSAPKGLITKLPAHQPLRVLHVVEPGERTVGAGRLRICGRMADVCAELDRLVERENRQAARLH
jgi:hypothetical protein